MIKFATNLLLFVLFVVIGITIALVLGVRRLATLVSNYPIEFKRTAPVSLNFSLANSPSSSMRGVVTELKGNVWWKSRTATESAALSSSTQIQQGEEIETKEDGNLTVEFRDGWSISLLPKSGLSIVQTLPDNLVFQQTGGTVIYKNSSGSPLAIRSLGLITQFMVGEAKITINKKTSTITVEANKGTLESAYNDLKYVTRVVKITQGKKLTFNNVRKKATIK